MVSCPGDLLEMNPFKRKISQRQTPLQKNEACLVSCHDDASAICMPPVSETGKWGSCPHLSSRPRFASFDRQAAQALPAKVPVESPE